MSFIYGALASYSPDGTKIVYASTQSGRTEMWVMNPDGPGRTQLTFESGVNGNNQNVNCDNPNWSPDGRIMFVSNRVTGTVQTWIINADGSNPRVLLSSNYGGGRLPWRK